MTQVQLWLGLRKENAQSPFQWVDGRMEATPTDHPGNRTTFMASNYALKCWHQELMGHISGMI